MKKRLRGKVQKSIAACLTVGMVLALTACGSPAKFSSDTATSEAIADYDSYDMSAESWGTNGYMADMNYDDYDAEWEEAESPMESSMEPSESSMDSGETADVVDSSRKLIKTVDMSVETKEFDAVLSTLEDQVSELGGYIESMDTYNGSSYSGYRSVRNASMVIRIPQSKLQSFLDTVSGISNVVRRSDNVEDVTLTYVDLESHKQVLQAEHDRLLEFLKQAETIEDMLTIEERISDIRYQLESMEARLRTYDNKVNYSTIYLEIDEVEELTPVVVEEETTWERISNGFMESLREIGDGLKEIGIWFAINSPYLVLWVVVIFVFVLIIRLSYRRSIKKKAKKQEKDQEKNQEE